MVSRLASFLVALFIAVPASAQQQHISADILTGWRTSSDHHIAAIVLTMTPGWHTYWRAPGDAGVPPVMDWSQSENLSVVDVLWPTPSVYWADGFRSIVYNDKVILPLVISPKSEGDIRLVGSLQLGVCKDICIPARLEVNAHLLKDAERIDSKIAAAMADQPYSAAEGNVSKVSCRILPDPRGLRLITSLELPRIGQTEDVVVETNNPKIWVAAPKTQRTDNQLKIETHMIHIDGSHILLERSGLRFTVLGDTHAIDIQGCG